MINYLQQYQNDLSLIDTAQLIDQYFSLIPNPQNSLQRVRFGTSGHRGSSIHYTFNENHILAIAQAIVECRKKNKIYGPCYIGKDTHALSEVAFISVLEVLSANAINSIIEGISEYTPAPVVAHAILKYNKNFCNNHLKSDGIVITSSHNPPGDGGIKYYSCYGGSADTDITENIEEYSNMFLLNNLRYVHCCTLNQAWCNGYIHVVDFTQNYITELTRIINIQSIKESGLRLCVDLMGGAGISCWQRIAQFYKLDLILVNQIIDPTFRFIYSNSGIFQMDCSAKLVADNRVLNGYNQFDLSFANDPDCDRYGIKTSIGFMKSNDYLVIAINYLFQNRPNWNRKLCIGKSIVSSMIIDQVVQKFNLHLMVALVGFKWFVKKLFYGSVNFVGEESSGGVFLDFNSLSWIADKDGIVMCLLAAEISAVTGRILQEFYNELIQNINLFSYNRIQIPINYYSTHERFFNCFILQQLSLNEIAGNPITEKIRIVGNKKGTKIDGIKLMTNNGWIAFRCSGTEKMYKIYSESFLGDSHREKIEQEAHEHLSYISNQMS